MSPAPRSPGRRARSRVARPDLLLNAVAAVLALAGLTLLVRTPTVSLTAAAPPALALPATPAAILATDPAALDAIVRANVFSPTRTPPRTRYAPPGGAPSVADDEVVAEADVPERAPVPQLYGTVVGASGATALIAMDPSASVAQVYRVGDRAGGWRVVRIDERSVVLEGAGGRVTLRLTRPDAPTVPSVPNDTTPWVPMARGSAGSRGDAESRSTSTAARAESAEDAESCAVVGGALRCHPERSEGSRLLGRLRRWSSEEILRCAQDDTCFLLVSVPPRETPLGVPT